MYRPIRRSTMTTLAAIVAVAGLAPALGGCVGAAVGGGAAVATAAAQERGFRGAIDDTVIRARINDLWLAHSEEMFRVVGLSVVEGRILLTGKVPNAQMRIDAVRLTWKARGVREVINEIKVTGEGGPASYARDAWISAQLKSKILFDKQILSINYSIETVDRVIYLMGIAQNQTELTRAINHARTMAYVKKVVSYVVLKDDPRRNKT